MKNIKKLITKLYYKYSDYSIDCYNLGIKPLRIWDNWRSHYYEMMSIYCNKHDMWSSEENRNLYTSYKLFCTEFRLCALPYDCIYWRSNFKDLLLNKHFTSNNKFNTARYNEALNELRIIITYLNGISA